MDPLKELIQSKRDRIKDLKAEVKLLKKAGSGSASYNKINKMEKEIEDTEMFLKRFKASNMQPMKVENIVINYKLYERFIKKLQGFFIAEEVQENALVIKYYKGVYKGELTLHDLTHLFPEGSVFPTGNLQEVALV